MSYFRDFGNNKTSKEEIPTIYFPKGGTYTVSLTVTNAAGASSTTKQEIKVLTPVIRKISSFFPKWGDLNFDWTSTFANTTVIVGCTYQ